MKSGSLTQHVAQFASGTDYEHILSARVDRGKGSKADPMSMDEVTDKFRECALYARWPAAKAEGAIALVRRLETIERVTELTTCLAQ